MSKYIGGVCVLIFSFIAFSSCDKLPRHSDKIKILDSLSTVLSTVETQLRVVDTTSIFDMCQKVDEKWLAIKQAGPDTVSIESAIVIEKMQNIKAACDVYVQKRLPFFDEVVNTKEQLRTLSHDLSKNIIDNEKAAEYFANEQQKSQKIIESLSVTLSSMSQLRLRFDSLSPYVDELIKQYTPVKDTIIN